jgi:hypothetical protein
MTIADSQRQFFSLYNPAQHGKPMPPGGDLYVDEIGDFYIDESGNFYTD